MSLGGGRGPVSHLSRGGTYLASVCPTAAIACSLLPLGFVALANLILNSTDQGFLWGFGTGASVALYLGCHYLAIPDWIENYRLGADGESGPLVCCAGWRTSRGACITALRSGRAIDDHIVLGPRGIFMLDTKCRSGHISVDSGQLVIRRNLNARPKREALASTSTRRATELAEMIACDTHYRPWVQSAIVIWGEFDEAVTESEGVTFLHGEQLIAWLTTGYSIPIPDWLYESVHGALVQIVNDRRAT